MTMKQDPPVRLNKEALKIIDNYRKMIVSMQIEREGSFTPISRSDVIAQMDRIIKSMEQTIKDQACKSIIPPRADDGLIREVKHSGGKTTINMPKEWTGKTVRVIEVKE